MKLTLSLLASKSFAIGIGIAVIVVLIVGIYFSQQVQQREVLQNVQISLGGINLKSLGLTSAILRLSLNMYNPNNSVTATLDRTEYQLYANGNELANGEIPNRYDIPPTSTVTVPTDVTVSYLDSLGAVFSALKNGAVNWEMKGISYFEMPILGTIQVPFDFTKTSQFSSNSNQNSNPNQENQGYSGNSNPQIQQQPSNLPAPSNNPQYQSNTGQNAPPIGNTVELFTTYFTLAPSSIQYLEFKIPCTAKVELDYYAVYWNYGQKFVVIVEDDNNFRIVMQNPNTHNYSYVYWSNGAKGQGSFIGTLQPDTYHITLSNEFDNLTPKPGKIFASYNCIS